MQLSTCTCYSKCTDWPVGLLCLFCVYAVNSIQVKRGGLITFHGPGQLVCYPVLNLRHMKVRTTWCCKYMLMCTFVMIECCFPGFTYYNIYICTVLSDTRACIRMQIALLVSTMAITVIQSRFCMRVVGKNKMADYAFAFVFCRECENILCGCCIQQSASNV